MMIQKYFKKVLYLFILLTLFSCTERDLTEEGVLGDSAMVVSAHPLASAVGVDILKKGGNAIDAAVAVQFALAVVYPGAGNIGGGGFMIIRMRNGNTDALDFREEAPGKATKDMYLNEEGEVIEGLSEEGHLSAGVPGTVDGMVRAHEKYGNLSWSMLVQPAVELAEEGFPLTAKEAEKLNEMRDALIRNNSVRPEFFLADDWEQGDSLVLKELAYTLTLIRDRKRAGFYDGQTAENIVAEMQRGGGIITTEDLENYKAIWRKPVEGNFKKYNVISMPPPSSGGIALLQLLSISENYPLEDWGWNTTETAHLMVEAEKRVYADRAKHLGDPGFYDVPASDLLDTSYLNERMENFSMDHATDSDEISAGDPVPAESKQTTHYSIVDSRGNAASVTTTLNSSFGSKVVVSGSGFLLNNEMDDFSIKAGYPNAYGLIGGEANSIEPGKRMLSSMTPTILEREGQLYMVTGSPGGSTIITSVYQSILNVAVHGFPMQGAVNAGRFHHQWKPDWIMSETGALGFWTGVRLWYKGHKIAPNINGIGRVDAILVHDDGQLEGAADPRGDDDAEGF